MGQQGRELLHGIGKPDGLTLSLRAVQRRLRRGSAA